MDDHHLQLARRLHHEHARQPHSKLVSVRAGDLIHLLNALWGEEQRADVAEETLKARLTDAAETRLDDKLAPAIDS